MKKICTSISSEEYEHIKEIIQDLGDSLNIAISKGFTINITSDSNFNNLKIDWEQEQDESK